MHCSSGTSIVIPMIVEKIDTRELIVMLKGQSGRGRPSWIRRITTMQTRDSMLISMAPISFIYQSVSRRDQRLVARVYLESFVTGASISLSLDHSNID